MAVRGSVGQFRQAFNFKAKDVFKQFPQHMNKALGELSSKLRLADAIIEVHDARIPFSGRTRKFDDILAVRPRLVIYNKVDLADVSQSQKEFIKDKIQETGGHTIAGVVFAACADEKDKQLQNLIPKLASLVLEGPRYHRQLKRDINVLVVGIPNVGKSTLINYLRSRHTNKKGKATQVGGVPGVTRSVSGRILISQRPPISVFDSPGILQPNIGNPETGMKLALCGTLPDHLVGEESIVDYMLYVLNKQKNFAYVSELNLDTPFDNVNKFLHAVASKQQFHRDAVNMKTGQMELVADVNRTARFVIGYFRSGRFGKILLDQEYFEQNII